MVLFFAFKESIKDPPLRNTETAASETRWERKEQLCTRTNKLLTCKIWKKKIKRDSSWNVIAFLRFFPNKKEVIYLFCRLAKIYCLICWRWNVTRHLQF